MTTRPPAPEVGTHTGTATGTVVATRDATPTPTKPEKPATPQDRLRAQLERFAPRLADLIPQGYTPERLITGAMLAAHRDPTLLQCTPASVATALAQVAQWGLDVGTTAHLVPFNTKVKQPDGGERWQMTCTAIADYKGFIELITAAGARKVEAHVVRQGDAFEYRLGTDPFLEHRPVAGNTGPILCAYAVVWLRGGVTQFEVVPVAEIEEIRGKSKSWKSGPLPAWYARKTAVRRLAKYVGKTPQLRAVLNAEAIDLGEIQPDLETEAAMARRLEAATGEADGRMRIPGPATVPSAGYDDVPTRPANVDADAGGVIHPAAEVMDMATKPKGPHALAQQPDPYEETREEFIARMESDEDLEFDRELADEEG